ncbi:MAG: transcriptional repressor [Firmicutes bacterium]|jgi:Fe2+ or Zn2+ uptake regulation protein|uniref:Fur family transcriptional regulator n=1 Tax=Sulfobacillus benefaciens TaxID=453960 RepID=A0A2T2X1G3_9FIRM|nr:transcriptional repressor [Bacillota bacterium]MCL5013930.1 transcriptional repressor [Bacillota bacterium]PSR28327.1 MAG: Fur family transcriptional regulator [Sulfobacillus benefaciens]HBQ95542.1 Fur family transcriptional regulator [Sulfobacillus sp.]
MGMRSATRTLDILRSSGIRITPQRLAVYESIAVLDHPAADEIYESLRGVYPAMSVATVYNTVERLVQEGLVHVVTVNGKRRYDFRLEQHDHLLCQVCHRLEDFPDDLPALGTPGPREIPVGGGKWKINQQTVIWEGICPTCMTSRS